MCISYKTDWSERGEGGEKMFEINQKVSWFAECKEMTGRVVDVENYNGELFYWLCEEGSHPRNGMYARNAESIQAV